MEVNNMNSEVIENITDILDEVVKLRKEVPIIYSEFCKDMYQKRSKYLDLLKYDIRVQELNVKLQPNPLENFTSHSKHETANKTQGLLIEQVDLLTIMCMKKTCPISKIIDKI